MAREIEERTSKCYLLLIRLSLNSGLCKWPQMGQLRVEGKETPTRSISGGVSIVLAGSYPCLCFIILVTWGS